MLVANIKIEKPHQRRFGLPCKVFINNYSKKFLSRDFFDFFIIYDQ